MYEQLETGQKFTAWENKVIPPTQLVRWAYEIVKETGLFGQLCKTWLNKPLADRTWPLFNFFKSK